MKNADDNEVLTFEKSWRHIFQFKKRDETEIICLITIAANMKKLAKKRAALSELAKKCDSKNAIAEVSHIDNLWYFRQFFPS